jgi:uncharacterized membrane protein
VTRPNDEQIDRAIGIILRTGVIIAAVVVLTGGVLYLSAHGSAAPSYSRFQGAPRALTHFSTIVSGVRSFNPLFIIQLGLLVLMATPVIRVVACAIGFALERDWTYVWISAIILSLLLVSLIGYSG